MAARVGAEAQAMRDLWGRTVEEVKRSVTSTTTYRALEKTVPVAWEESFFVIGFSGTDGQLGAQLNTGEYRMIIERALRKQSGDLALKFRLVDGSTYEEWEHTKQRDVVANTSRQQVMEKRSVEAKAATSWDEVYEQISRLWAASEFRALPTGRARYLDNALGITAKAMETIYPVGGKADEGAERGLSRIVERIASMTSSDAAVIAYLLFDRCRKV